ncbi:biotin carboxyl carrier protein [Streptohalobacillus salinus]|uniref:Biotin carboxyl carrier protein of acetyl-CoA carboxylase n=1 Tax=Streptohalobacillus salinus TaxID=621096 RepID=A0A2V3WB24_9BACI|nr:acetyl-CoA carboxylase biotin carboxyl carrier protein [Streptohalobacillus salinus]PXW91667.1 biotin carboxyl carrier protein [Streptohalobacillus salinus]
MFNITDVKQLIEAVDASSIRELSYEGEEGKLTLRKDTHQTTHTAVQQPATVEPTLAPVEQKPVNDEAVAVNSEKEVNYDHVIHSPMVGTFYLTSSPDTPPYVEVGDTVTEKSVVCIIEAMKLFNEIEAEVDGTIVEILAKNGELVEYNQPLFGIKKA